MDKRIKLAELDTVDVGTFHEIRIVREGDFSDARDTAWCMPLAASFVARNLEAKITTTKTLFVEARDHDQQAAT